MISSNREVIKKYSFSFFTKVSVPKLDGPMAREADKVLT